MTTAMVQKMFEETPVRGLVRDGKPWFVGRDVCEALEIRLPHQAIGRLDGDDRDTTTVTDSLGRPQETAIINEPGLYSLVLTSRKPAAKRFKRWVTHDLIPAVLNTGHYVMPGHPTAEPNLMADALGLIADHMRLMGAGQQEIIARLQGVEAQIGLVVKQTEQTYLGQAGNTMTVAHYCNQKGLNLDMAQRVEFSKKAGAYSTEHRLPVGRTFGSKKYPGGVKQYTEEALEAVFKLEVN